MAIAWDLGVPTTRRGQRYGYAERNLRRWEVMTNWADDAIEEEAEEGDGYRSDGDVLGEVTGKVRRRIPTDNTIPYEEQWETDMDAYQALKVRSYIDNDQRSVKKCVSMGYKREPGSGARLSPTILLSIGFHFYCGIHNSGS